MSSISMLLTRCLLPLDSLRSLSLTSPAPARSKPSSDDEAVSSEPIKFSTSKASHRTWRVDRSLGSQHERPWWKVVPVSLAIIAFLLWCVIRPETDVDTQLEKQLYERLPGLTSDQEEGGKEWCLALGGYLFVKIMWTDLKFNEPVPLLYDECWVMDRLLTWIKIIVSVRNAASLLQHSD